MRDYVAKIAQDKKRELVVRLRAKLAKERAMMCEPPEESTDTEADDTITILTRWGPLFARIDALVEGYETRATHRGDRRHDALETVKRILEF